MLDNQPDDGRDLSYDSPVATSLFVGIRFFLFGFDQVAEIQYRSELVNGGGVDVGRYDSSCTHVIVHRVVYDDPVCFAARRDGKTLVTELWVEDSLEFERLADTTRILYSPVKDLKGIPGCDSLYICLTGYQKKERDDIMKMVDLMGAHFTKPLQASIVTHLICYKFEGEKYKLARQIPRIKLINHRWLEDCLKEWKILAEDKYSKSGWELEISEAEARDSEEEADKGVCAMPLGKKHISGSSSILQREMVTPRATPVRRVSGIHEDVEAVNGSYVILEKVLVNHSLFSTPNKVANTDKSSTLNDVKSKDLDEVLKHQGVGAQSLMGNYDAMENNLVGGSATIPRDKIINCKNEGKHISSEVKTGKRSPNSNATNDTRTSLFFSRKTPRKSTDTVVLEELTSQRCGSSRAQFVDNKINYAFNSLPLTIGDLENGETQSPRSGEEELTNVARQIDTMPDKRKESRIGPSSPMEEFLHNTEMHAVKSSSRDAKSAKLDATCLMTDAPNIKVDRCPDNKTISLKGVASVDPAADRQTDPPKNQSSVSRERSLRRTAPRAGISNNAVSPLETDLEDLRGDGKLSFILDKQLGTSDTNYLSKIEPDETLCSGYGGELTNVERNSGTLPEKRKEAVSHVGLLSTREEDLHKAECYPVESSPRAAKSDKLVTDTPNLNVDPCLSSKISPLKGVALGDSVADRQTGPQRNQSLGLRKKSLKSRPLRTKIGKSTVSPSNAVVENFPGVGEPGLILDKQISTSDISNCLEPLAVESRGLGPEDRKTATSLVGLEKSEFAHRDNKDILLTGSSKLNEIGDPEISYQINEGADAGKHRGIQGKKPADDVTKKVTSKKNLSCRPKVTSGNHRKGNTISYSDKAISRDQLTICSEKPKDGEPEKIISKENKTGMGFLTSTSDIVNEENTKGHQRSANRMKRKSEAEDDVDTSLDAGKENISIKNKGKSVMFEKYGSGMAAANSKKMPKQKNTVNNVAEMDGLGTVRGLSVPRPEPQWFILSGHHLQKKEFHQVIKCLRGRVCRDSHHWSYQATHFILPDPARRTEKFFAAAAAGRWILKTDYLTASNQAGRFLAEEPFEWHKNGLSEDGAINLEAPRKWRLLREKTGHGAFYGMRIIIYGECIAPPLDTLKRVVKAGGGTILATSPPYHRFLKSGVDFAIVCAGMPRVDSWVQEFLSHEIPCVLADYLVEYVCKPGYSLERHVLYKTHAWAEKSFANLLRLSEEIVETETSEDDDLVCQVCGSGDRGGVMLICGNDSGSLGCGVGVHIDCCVPPLEAVPEQDWFCSICKTSSHSRSCSSAAKKSKKGSSILKCR